ncbi:hypothetical protein B481_1292 [Planococcus halocryophilus Or1]|nr:hypothetical protein B481_1292 [Planococcus halocryophilus Or1]
MATDHSGRYLYGKIRKTMIKEIFLDYLNKENDRITAVIFFV